MTARLVGFSHVALTVRDIETSRRFYTEVLGMAVIDAHEGYCALHTGSEELSALILTTHEATEPAGFSELRVGLDHVSLAVPDEEQIMAWQERLAAHDVRHDARRSDWGHHVNFRDPDGIAVELVLLDPDPEVRAVLDAGS